MTNKPMLSVERLLTEIRQSCELSKSRDAQIDAALVELRAILDKPVEDVDDEQWYADTPDGDSALVTRVGALTEWQKGRDGMRAERDAALSELSELKAAKVKGEPVGCRYRKTDRPDRCWTYCDGVKVTPWKGWEVQPLFTGQPAAQHQGEPVYQSCWTGDGGGRWIDLSKEDFEHFSQRQDYITRIVYAEQPAPVAVVMPDDWEDQLFSEMSRRFDLRKQIDDDHMVYDDTQIGVEFARDWIKARLNGVKP